MIRSAAVLMAALTIALVLPAARAHAQAAGPFPEVSMPKKASRSSAMAYVCIGTGLGLLGGSTLLSDRANDRYQDYLRATDPESLRELYDQTLRLDRLSTGSLLTGEVLIATGLYLRFLRRPPAVSRVALDVRPSRCAVVLRF